MQCVDGIGWRWGILTVTLVVTTAISCSSSKPLPLPSSKPDKLTLYEGLPHQFYEAEQLVEERKKPNVEKGGFPFYRDPLTLKEDDAEALAVILATPDTFQPFSGEKKCGGFHPDYAIVVSEKGEEFIFLICFGCGEAMVYRPDRSETRYDLARDASRQRLSTILKSYRLNRPMPPEGA